MAPSIFQINASILNPEDKIKRGSILKLTSSGKEVTVVGNIPEERGEPVLIMEDQIVRGVDVGSELFEFPKIGNKERK